MAVDAPRYEDAILFPTDGERSGSLMGEPAWALRQAEEAGIIYNCTAEDGSCGHGVHTSEPGPSAFWHLMPGKTYDEYNRATEEEAS